MIRYIFKPKRKPRSGQKKQLSDSFWYGRYRLTPKDRLITISLETTDKRLAEDKFKKIIRNAELRANGQEPVEEQSDQRIEENLRDWEADAKARKLSSLYIENVGNRIRRIARECNWVYLADVTRDGFVTWRAKQPDYSQPRRNEKNSNLITSSKTLNDYQDAICAFFQWMNDTDRYTKANPLKKVQKAVIAGHEKRKRRALTLDELERLRNVSGNRWYIYWVALLTGLRRGELNKLTWDDARLEHDPPYLKIRASTTKNRKEAIIPLRLDVAEYMRSIRPQKVAGAVRIFFKRVPLMTTLRKDLEAAGIPFEDAHGRRADFHAFRHSTATYLAIAGVAERVAMEFMRHSDPKLTRKIYTDAALLPTANVMKQLPSFPEQTQDDQNEMRSQKTVSLGTNSSEQCPTLSNTQKQEMP